MYTSRRRPRRRGGACWACRVLRRGCERPLSVRHGETGGLSPVAPGGRGPSIAHLSASSSHPCWRAARDSCAGTAPAQSSKSGTVHGADAGQDHAPPTLERWGCSPATALACFCAPCASSCGMRAPLDVDTRRIYAATARTLTCDRSTEEEGEGARRRLGRGFAARGRAALRRSEASRRAACCCAKRCIRQRPASSTASRQHAQGRERGERCERGLLGAPPNAWLHRSARRALSGRAL